MDFRTRAIKTFKGYYNTAVTNSSGNYGIHMSAFVNYLLYTEVL